MKTKRRNVLHYLYYALLFLVFAASIYIRFKNLGGRSLWLDEAWVANAISESSFQKIIHSSLTAPLFFVFTIHTIVIFFGNNEFFLRLLPCLFGIGTLAVFYLIIRKHTGKAASLISLTMLSFSYNTVHYSQELKQYSGAMFFTILLIFLCERIIARNKMLDWVLLVFISIIGLGFDHSIIFIIPTVFVVLLIFCYQKQEWRKIFISGSAAFAFSVLLFLFHIRDQMLNNLGNIQSYWLPYYPKATSILAILKWLARSTHKMFDFFAFPYFSASLIIIIVGLSLFYKNSKKRFIIYTLLPILLVLGASFLQRYPFGGSRLMLFAAPLLYLSFAKGLNYIIIKLKRSRLGIPLLFLIAFLAFPPVSTFIKMDKNPLRLEEMRPLLEKLEKRIKPEDKIYVYYGAYEAFKYYYNTKYSRMTKEKNIIWGEYHRDDVNKYIADLEKILDKNMRVWILFSHYWEKERIHIIEYLNQRGNLKTKISDKSTLGYLFEITSDSSEIENASQ